MSSLSGKSVAAQAMHQKYSAQSGTGRVPTMMMGQQKTSQMTKSMVPSISMFNGMQP
jgi:hypothetical protein